MNKILIITYYWPPSGGAGVQRWLKFSKYLPQFGWEPFILTVDPAYAAYPVTDNSLNADIPEGIKVFKTKATDYFSIYKKDKSKIPTAGFANSLDNSFKGKLMRFVRGNFFLPDPRKGWNSFAFKKACELIDTEGINHVVTTSPPHSTQLIGLKIKKKYPGIKWTADLRDPWTDIYYYKQFYPTIISKWIDSGYEKRVLINADKIITVGASLKEAFSSKVKGLELRTEVITNGYDESDFKDIPAILPSKLTITYVGTLSDIYPVSGLIDALRTIKTGSSGFVLRFVGSVSVEIKELIMSQVPDKALEFLPHVSHQDSIRFMMSSTILMLIIPLHKSNKSIITGKIFEYLATGKPVLCIGPVNGDAAEIIRSSGAGETFDYNDYQSIAAFMNDYPGHPGKALPEKREQYSRIELTKILSEALRKEI